MAVARPVDLTHAAFADLLDQVVVEELLPGFDVHGRILSRGGQQGHSGDSHES